MYDVVFIDGRGEETVVAGHLADRDAAGQIARRQAADRGVGRMVLPGSSKHRNCVCVVPVDPRRDDAPNAAAPAPGSRTRLGRRAG
jgi:hypothetical protein